MGHTVTEGHQGPFSIWNLDHHLHVLSMSLQEEIIMENEISN